MPKVVCPRVMPNCFTNLSSESYLPAMTLEQAMEAYWRVKTWRIQFGCTFVADNFVGPPTVSSFYHDFNLAVGLGQGFGTPAESWTGGVAPATEVDLVCGPGFNWGFSVGPEIGGRTSAFSSTGLKEDGGEFGFTSCEVSAAGPFIQGNQLLLNVDVFGNIGVAIMGIYGPNPGAGWPINDPAGSFIMNLNSGTLSAELRCLRFAEGSISGNIIMTPVEYWSFGGTWDVSSGLPL